MTTPIAKFTITCVVISRTFEAEQADLARCDRSAVVAFGHRASELELANSVQVALIFDGLETNYEISLGTLTSDDSAQSGSSGGKNVN
jgi:hypothetical protein